MPIASIISQPGANGIRAAYRPIIFRIAATATGGGQTPPVVYCDIYFNSVYYKSLSKTQPASLNGSTNSEWQFDIQDALQEFLKKAIGDNGGNQITGTSGVMTPVYVKFRSSGFDANGFTVAEDTAPVQGTGGTAPTSGTGTQSNTFFAINSTLQHEHNQDLASHLSFYKNNTWAANAFPLTHRSKTKYKVCKIESDFFPVLYTGNKTMKCLKLFYRNKGQTAYTSILNCSLGCSLSVTDVTTYFSYISGDGYAVFHAAWDLPNGEPPDFYHYVVEYNDGSGWLPVLAADDLRMQELDYYIPSQIAHQVRITAICANGIHGTSGVGSYSPVTCNAVVITGTPALPDGVENSIYRYSFYITGDAPITMTVVTKPAWMTINLSGNRVVFSGMPGTGDIGTGINVEIHFSNCSGASTATFSDTIDVIAGSGLTGDVTIINNSAGWGITGASYTLGFPAGSFPLYIPDSATGFHAAFTGSIDIGISGFGFDSILTMKVNGTWVQDVVVTSTGVKTFTSRAYLSSDNIEITLHTS